MSYVIQKAKQVIEGGGNFIDRAVSYVSPERGLKRLQARAGLAVAGAFVGAKKDRRQTKEWNTAKGDADALILDDLDTLRERSVDAWLNIPLGTGAIKTNCTAIIGPGLTVQPRIDREVLGLSDEAADKWERTAQREFRNWAESEECHAGRTLNFGEIQKIAFLGTMIKGDSFVSLPRFSRRGSKFNLKLQIIDAERVTNIGDRPDSPTLSGGIQRDSRGAPVFYHVLKQHPYTRHGINNKEWVSLRVFGERTGRRNVLHVCERTMPNQSRGVPYLSPVIETLKMIDRFTEAELMAAVVSSFFTVFVTTEGGGTGLAQMPDSGGTTSDNDFKMGGGAILGLAPGEKIETADPSRPNTAFEAFVTAVLRQIAVALELPYEILIKHFTSSYSASRAAILEAWRFFMARRKWWTQKLCDPVYAAWMDEAVANGTLSAPGYFSDESIRKAYLAAVWNGPARGHIDELKEVKAARERTDAGFSTGAQETAEINGGDFDKNVKRIKKENEMKKEAGMVSSEKEQTSPAPIENDNPNKGDIEDETT